MYVVIGIFQVFGDLIAALSLLFVSGHGAAATVWYSRGLCYIV